MQLNSLTKYGLAILSLFGSILMFTGCLKDGIPDKGDDIYKLALVPSDTEVNPGDSVSFDIWLLDEIVEADLFINNEKITGTTHRFAEQGVYDVFAQKEGVKNSDTIQITVGDVTALSKLELLVTAMSEQLGTGIWIYIFDVQSNGVSIDDADLYVDNEKIAEYRHRFEPRTDPYTVFARKAGYLDSDTMQINVRRQPRYKLFVRASSEEINTGETVTFQTGYVNVEPIYLDADVYINNEKIQGYSHTFNLPGSYTVIAKMETYEDSDPVTITVKEQQQTSSPVFISGFEGEGSSAQAKLWRGGAAQATTLGNGYATDMFDFHGSLYISGYVSNETANNYAAKYWNHFPDERSTQETVLHNGKAYANSIFVEPADGGVLVGGSIGTEAAYWLWEESTMLDSDGDAVVKGAGYNEGQVYAVGRTTHDGKPQATIWALGDRWSLSGGKESEANAIAMQNGEYFVAGWVREGQTQRAVYWDANGAHLLPGEGMVVEATDIKVKNNKVYVVGNLMNFSERHLAVLWINKTMYTLNEMPDRHAFAHSVAVGNDGTIYVAGSVQEWLSDNRTAVYWQINPSGSVMKTVNLTDGSKDAAGTGIVLDN